MEHGLQKIYRQVAHNYELVNHVLTFGFDLQWRKQAARLASSARPQRCVDVCSGTGEMAHELKVQLPGSPEIVATDFSQDMLRKAKQQRGGPGIRFSLAEAGHLPFPDSSFDLVTISFATRNINRDRDTLGACFREFHRVLRPGGMFLNLETSQPQSRLWRSLFHLYIRLTVRPVGTLLTGSRAGYAYLSHTIPRFYESAELCNLMVESGFSSVDVRAFLGGIAAIHLAHKKGDPR